MQYYARITFYLDNDYSFSNLSNGPIQLFKDGEALCIAYENRLLRRRVVIEYGPFPTGEEAERRGTNLVRCIKLDMIRREFPIGISDGSGGLDSPRITPVWGGVSRWVKLCAEYGLEGEHKIIENDCVGLGVYEVKDNLSEIQFVNAEGHGELSTKFALDNKVFKQWNKYMDTSLSLLVSSVSINDMRVKFLLRMMAIEALVAERQNKGPEHILAIEQLTAKIDEMEISVEHKDYLKARLGEMKNKSVSQKARELLRVHLSDKLYSGQTAEQLFVQCYKVRSSFVHSGDLLDSDIAAVHELKIMCLDLLCSMSEAATPQ